MNKINLENIFNNVNDWLKFAEAKNGIIAAFTSTISLAIFSALIENKISNIYFCIYLSYSSLLLFGSALIALASFLPQLNDLKFIAKEKKPPEKNLLFFGYIKNFSGEQYLNEIEKQYGKINENDNYKLDISKQISVNSKIAFVKYRCFTLSLWLTLMAFFSPLLLLIIPLWNFIKRRL